MDPGIRTAEYIAIFPVGLTVLVLIILGAPYYRRFASYAWRAVIKFKEDNPKKFWCSFLLICCAICISLYFAYK